MAISKELGPYKGGVANSVGEIQNVLKLLANARLKTEEEAPVGRFSKKNGQTYPLINANDDVEEENRPTWH